MFILFCDSFQTLFYLFNFFYFSDDIPSGLPLGLNHMISCLLYTNWDELQFEFKKYGTRKVKESDDYYIEVLQRNREIAHWYILLKECVVFYGSQTSIDSKTIFYHGLSVKLLFAEFQPKFFAPLSTTGVLSIAQSFAQTGIVLKLIPIGIDFFLDVRWFSDQLCF